MRLIIEEIVLLLELFESKAPDKESNQLVRKFCEEKHRWIKAHGLHSTIRDRNLKAIKNGNNEKEAQYNFEKSVAKTLFNLTNSSAPFDSDSPYWVLKNAFTLARQLDIPEQKIIDIIA